MATVAGQRKNFANSIDFSKYVPIEYVLEIDENPRQYLDLTEEILIPESSGRTRNPSSEWRF